MKIYNPVSTYRLQLHKDFTFKDAEEVILYLHSLGIKTIYASPVFQAAKGSLHGYDVTNPLQLNPEIGDNDSFDSLIRTVHEKEMGWIQDFVPNHMAYSPENPWIYDILLKGKNSGFFSYFDIFTDHPDKDLREKIMLPFFGKPMEEVINEGELSLEFEENGFSLRYFENKYPLSIQAYATLFKCSTLDEAPPVIGEFEENLSNKKIKNEDIENLYQAYKKKNTAYEFINECLKEVNSDPSLMKKLVDELSYIPVYWKETEKRINFRRFFTINSLICLNTHDKEVFMAYHKYLKTLLEQKYFDGIRIDHIDGLADPNQYLEDLRNLAGSETYISVEKILEEDEKLPEKWPVEGSTGYDFLAIVNNLLANKKNAKDLYSFYGNWSEDPGEIHDILHDKKRFILHNRLKGELDILVYQCRNINFSALRSFDKKQIKEAIAEFLVFCPVYKIYNIPSAFDKKEKDLIKEIFKRAIQKNKYNKEALYVLRSLFLLSEVTDSFIKRDVDAFFRRCMQFTGPLMAKGIEDTAFYSYNPFIAFNEVGDNPGYFGISTKKFHRLMEERQQKTPLTMNTLASHDTKRGDDARARINVIGDIPKKWRKITKHWQEINRNYKADLNGRAVPTPNDEYFIYQTLCAHLPMNGEINDDFIPRLKEYLVKAFRESKVNTSWSEPDNEYENKTQEFLDKILSHQSNFRISLVTFVKEIIPHGINNSLTQTILKNTAPGVPDTYQGSEIWNLSFVDPDNRRPVDYKNLANTLEMLFKDYLADPVSMIERLWQNTTNGFIKQWISYLTLQERIKNPDLFSKGSYIPLKTKGKYKKHIIAFLRRHRDSYLLIVLPLNTALLPLQPDWENTRVILPDISPPKWENRITREIFKTSDEFLVKDIFSKVPFGIYSGIIPEPRRKAGILMHVSSLPGEYGIGDFGPHAREFVDFLHKTGQHYWQVLPLSQSDKLTGYSPYSSYSAFAGNTLLIDPLHLVNQGLLDQSELVQFKKKTEDKVDYLHAEEAKHYYLDTAFRNYQKEENEEIRDRLLKFQQKENYWLEDFGLFLALKRYYEFLPWNEWPEEYRDRNPEFLERFKREHKEEIEKIIFKQFIVSEQWNDLKEYANGKGIDIFGDIPIYIDYDSADVWSHPGLFRLNEDKSMEAVAGVPPDYFNENGQLWGMPLFNWEKMKANGYEWWLSRIRRNLEWFDLLRLDHFRGFSAYWEVPAEDEVALNGRWIAGPANDFFDVIQKEFPHMPFVAEDLGQIDQPVYDLRDDYDLPGMRVIQFGFEKNMPWLQHTPINFNYNSIAYTGTHDNNTMKGWYRKEVSKATLKRFKKYTGKKLKERNCHLEMIRLAYASIAKTAIIPIQDWLGLDENSRMNFPSTTEGNWLWKLKDNQIKSNKLENKIRKMAKTFGRI